MIDQKFYRERLSQTVAAASRKYPDAWKTLDALRGNRAESGLGPWPNWCFCPLAGTAAIVARQHNVKSLENFAQALARGEDPNPEASPLLDIGRIGCLGAWRCSQGVYVIDPDVDAALMSTPASKTLPVEVLMGLPQWSIFVATPGTDIRRGVGGNQIRPINGFFAYLDHDADTQRPSLRIMVDYADRAPFVALDTDVISLEPGMTLDGAFRDAVTGTAEHRRVTKMTNAEFERIQELAIQEGSERLEPFISRLLYLCSETAEYRKGGDPSASTPGNATATRSKRDGWRFFPPDGPTFWFVGDTIGTAIREAKTAERRVTEDRQGPRPHVRRAHWHSFWTGPKDGERKIVLKWLPPIAVALVEEMPEQSGTA